MNVSAHSSTSSPMESPSKISCIPERGASEQQISYILQRLTKDLLADDTNLPSSPVENRSSPTLTDSIEELHDEDDVLELARGLHNMVRETCAEKLHKQLPWLPFELNGEGARYQHKPLIILPKGVLNFEELLNDETKIAEDEDDIASTGTIDSLEVYRARRQRAANE